MTSVDQMTDTEAAVLDTRTDMYAYLHREGMAHLYGDNIAYARLYRLMGMPRHRPPFNRGVDYGPHTAQPVLDAAVHNAVATTRSSRTDPTSTPLNAMVARSFSVHWNKMINNTTEGR